MMILKLKIYVKLLTQLLIAIVLLTSPVAAVDTAARAAFVLDHTTGTILLSKNANEPLQLGSMSKIMTLYMAFEALQDGRLSLNQKLPVSQHSMNYGGSTMFLNTSDRVRVSDLIRGIIVLSANDASAVIAEALSPDGTERGFATQMNRRAKKLGMNKSHFSNSNGWPEKSHVMSLRDLAFLADRLIQEFPEFYPMFAEKNFPFDGRGPSNSFNRNPLLSLGIGADGLKTGHTNKAGYGIIGSAKRGGRRIILALSGLDSPRQRALESDLLIEWAFSISAKSCEFDTTACTPKELCEAATTTIDTEKVWAIEPSLSRHVEIAKLIGIDCGVIEKIATCISNPELCTIQQLCENSTFTNASRRSWAKEQAYQKHVKLAQSYGLNCDVPAASIVNEIVAQIESTAVSQKLMEVSEEHTKRPKIRPTDGLQTNKNCHTNEKNCEDNRLCVQATTRIADNPIIWEEKPEFSRFVKEAKSRGLACGVETECTMDSLSKCSDTELCLKQYITRWSVSNEAFNRGFYCKNSKQAILPPDNATFCDQFTSRGSMSGAEPYWLPKGARIEAKRRGITCGVEPKRNCSENPATCDDNELCSLATYTDSKTKRLIWRQSLNKKYAALAEARGLSCDVKVSSGFLRVTQQPSTVTLIQQELNRVGCNVGSPDGLIGPKTRKGLFAFTSHTEFLYNPKLMQDRSFLNAIKNYPKKTCQTKKPKQTRQINQTSPSPSNNSAELRQLQLAREQLEANLLATQQLMDQQKRAAERPYKACRANCLLNNKAGKGFAALMSGLAQCYSSCAPLKWGGTVVPPTWERDVKQLKSYDCMITKLNRNQASLDCNQF